MRYIYLIFVCLFILFVTLRTVHGCSCLPNQPSIGKVFNQTTLVFVGVARNVKNFPSRWERRITFVASKVYKSPRCRRLSYMIYTASLESLCGLSIREGQTWQIWATKYNDQYEANYCSKSTMDLSENSNFLRRRRCYLS